MGETLAQNTETMAIILVLIGEGIVAIGGPVVGSVKYFPGSVLHGSGFPIGYV